MRARGAELAVLGVGVSARARSLSVWPLRTLPPALAVGLWYGNAFFKIDSFILFWGAHPFLKTPTVGVSPFSSFENMGGGPSFLSSSSEILSVSKATPRQEVPLSQAPQTGRTLPFSSLQSEQALPFKFGVRPINEPLTSGMQ